MSYQRIVIETPNLDADQFESVVPNLSERQPGLQSLKNFVSGVQSGVRSAVITVNVGAVHATATITSTGTAGNDETMKLCNQTLTAKTSGAVAADGEFNISGTVGTQAANIAAAINAMPELVGLVTASANAGVVTVTAVVPGAVGNGLECADVDLANVAVSGFTGGDDGTEYELDFE